MAQVQRCPKCEEPMFMCECKPEVFIGKEVKEIYHQANNHNGNALYVRRILPTIIVNHQEIGLLSARDRGYIEAAHIIGQIGGK